MARLKRLLIPGQLHYVQRYTEEGCSLQEVDIREIIEVIAHKKAELKLHIHAYCVLPTSLHLLLTPLDDSGLASLMRFIGRHASTAYNRRHPTRRYGNVWQPRYRAGVFQDNLALSIITLIESFAVRTNVVARACDYAFSSYGQHSGTDTKNSWLHPHRGYLATANTPFEREMRYHSNFSAPSEDVCSQIIYTARHNWVMGDESFIAQMAQQSDRPVQKSKSGRRPKASPSS